VDTSDVSRWFDAYLAAYAACGRGEQVTVLNSTSALVRGAFAYHRSDGAEISRGSLT